MGVKAPGTDLAAGQTRLRGPRDARSASTEAAAGRFLVSLHVLGRARRLYQKDHPKIDEALISAERSLHETLAGGGTLAVTLERGQVLFRGRALSDTRGELKTLCDELLRRGITSVEFERDTHSGELLSFAEVFENSPAPEALQSDSAAAWKDWLAKHRIAAIRVNPPVAETRADALLPRILATVLEQRVKAVATETSAAPAGQTAEDGLITALRLLDALAGILPAGGASSSDAAREAAREFERALANADRNAVLLLAGSMDLHPPRSGGGETLEQYFARLAEELALGFSVGEYRAGRLRISKLREYGQRIGRGVATVSAAHPAVLASIAGWASERGAGEFELLFWSELTQKELNDVLRSEEAWTVPAAILRMQLDEADTTASVREARSALVAYTRCLLSPDTPARKATAAGLSDLSEALARFWPEQLPEEFGATILEALVKERVPAVAALLVSVVEHLAEAALGKGRYAEYERVFLALEGVKHSDERDHLRLVERNLFEGDRWESLISGALAHRPLDASLARLLGRDPERLLDRLTLMLSPPGGEALGSNMEHLPAMVRLVRTIGEPAIQALARRVFDKRLGRVTAAVKLLGATRPQELLQLLPQALSAWDWSVQDLAISELARQGVAGLGPTLIQVLPKAHLYVVPMIIDQLGGEGDPAAVPYLVQIAAGDNERLRDVFIRIKAIEALGRLRAVEAALLLRTILRQRNGLTYAEPAGLRAAAEEALQQLEGRMPVSRQSEEVASVPSASATFVRARRYPRYPLESPWRANIQGTQPAAARVKTISMGGACLQSSRRLAIGDSFPVEIKSGLKTIRPMAVVRNVQQDGSGVEFIHMDSDDREKLRRLLKGLSK